MNSLHKTLWTLAALLILGLFACFTHQLAGPAPTYKMLAMVLLLGFAGMGLIGAYMLYALEDLLKRQLEPKVGGVSGCTAFSPQLQHRQNLELAAMTSLASHIVNNGAPPRATGKSLRAGIDALLGMSASVSMECSCGPNEACSNCPRNVPSIKPSADGVMASAWPGSTGAPTVAGNKVTPADIEAAIAHEIYFSGDNGFTGAQGGVFDHYCIVRPEELAPQQTLQLMTFCVLILKNGFKVVGTSACVDPSVYNVEDGHKYAREEAIKQLWPVLGYDLCNKLAKQRM